MITFAAIPEPASLKSVFVIGTVVELVPAGTEIVPPVGEVESLITSKVEAVEVTELASM